MLKSMYFKNVSSIVGDIPKCGGSRTLDLGHANIHWMKSDIRVGHLYQTHDLYTNIEYPQIQHHTSSICFQTLDTGISNILLTLHCYYICTVMDQVRIFLHPAKIGYWGFLIRPMSDHKSVPIQRVVFTETEVTWSLTIQDLHYVNFDWCW